MNRVDYNAPNTRARIAARRNARRAGKPAQSGSLVRPGLRRVIRQWAVTGRLFSLLLLICTLGLMFFMFTSPRYQVQQIEVQGNTALDAAAVQELVGIRGASIWFADTAAAQQRLLSSAYIERAQVLVSLPDRALVSVVERRPDVRWQVAGVQYLVDASGRVLDIASVAAEPGTLVIVDASRQPVVANGHVDPDALELARRLSLRLPQELQFTPTSIGWDIGLGVFVTTESNQTIVFGQTEHLERKIAVLGYLLSDKTAFTYLDLRPTNPFYQNAAGNLPAAGTQPTAPSDQ